jgi:hypothetical protein
VNTPRINGTIPSTRRGWQLAWLYFGAVTLGFCLVILTAATPPVFVDYPDWVYQGSLLHGVLTGHPVPGYVMKHYPVPFVANTIAIGFFNLFTTWQMAGKLWICFYLILSGFATWMLANALRVTNPLAIVVLPAATFINLEFWWGRCGFEVGMCLVMILIALAIRGARPIVMSLLLLAIFFTHMEALACAFLFLGLWVLETRKWRELWVTIPALLLSVWYAVARFGEGNADASSVPHSNWRYGSRDFFLFKANTYLKIFSLANARTPAGLSQSEQIFGRPLLVLLILLSACFAVLCLISVVVAALRLMRTDRRYLALFVLLLVPASIIVPQIALGSTDPGSRLVVMGAAIGFFLMDWRGPVAKTIACLSIVICVANLWQFALLDHNPYLPGHARDLPQPLLDYAHTQPSGTLIYYDHLRSGEMNMGISTTAMFLKKK